MKFFTMDQLAAGIKDRHVGAERARLVEKWSRTGLLRGLDGHKRETMAQLLENQAAQVLKEVGNSLSTGGANVASSGQIQGFTNIAFPIVRRVFGGLVANELVSIQPMSLPSGLIFYLDYTYGSNVGGEGTSSAATYASGQSIYNNPTGRGVQSGSLATGGMYDLVNIGFTKVHKSAWIGGTACPYTTGSNGQIGAWNNLNGSFMVGGLISAMSGVNGTLCNFDPNLDVDMSTGVLNAAFLYLNVSDVQASITAGDFLAIEQVAVFALSSSGGLPSSFQVWSQNYQSGNGVLNLRRLNKRGNFTSSSFTLAPLNGTQIQTVLQVAAQGTTWNGAGMTGAGTPAMPGGTTTVVRLSMALTDAFSIDSSQTGATLTIPSFESDFNVNPSPVIPEIDIKIESIAIVATTRKLRARWSPELAQDLNAYHSMDAEVELTSILSEQIALEIDREILNDLVTEANGANMYWSRAPGRFVNKLTGVNVTLTTSLSIGPQFTGTVREWYETLVETIIDCANTIHRKTLRGSANFMVTSPDVATILESSVLYKPKFSIDGEGQVGSPFTIGAEAIGTLSNRFTVYKDPYFPRNRILVGYKGGSYLETGYVYSPYVPLIVTPTIFAPEDFTPRKGVMTRYGKKVVRSDFYGTVTVLDMNII
jgi:hypothetical protein